MTTKPVVPRQRAAKDAEEIVDHYADNVSEDVALGFVAALEQAYAHIGEQPATGSLRYALELELPGLRAWPLARYPYFLFYIEREDHIDLWRILHGKRDLPVGLQEPADEREIG